MGTVQKPLLWMRALSIEVQDVNKRMDKRCDHCAGPVARRRLLIQSGHGRGMMTLRVCAKCGKKFISAMAVESGNASAELSGCSTGEPIRTDTTREFFKKARERVAARKAAKAAMNETKVVEYRGVPRELRRGAL